MCYQSFGGNRRADARKVSISMGYVGLGATNTATNNILLFMRGTDDARMRIPLSEGSGIRIQDLRDACGGLCRNNRALVEGVLVRRGCSPEEAETRAKVFLRFRAGRHREHRHEFWFTGSRRCDDCRSRTGNSSNRTRGNLEEMKTIPSLRDVQVYQQPDYPTVRVEIDREKAGLSGVTVKDVTDALLVGTSSSRYVAKNYWRDPKSGVDYQVQVQVPTQRMNRPPEVETLPLQRVNPDTNLMVRDVAKVQTGTVSGEIDRGATQRYLSITANIEGDDLGQATARIATAIADAGEPPRGVRVSVRGQVTPMTQMFESLTVGLALSVMVILVLLTGFFQLFRVGLILIGAVPGVVCGVAIILASDGDYPEYRLFMGSIMRIGVALSTPAPLSAFIDDHWRAGASVRRAAVEGARDRLRLIPHDGDCHVRPARCPWRLPSKRAAR